MSQFWSAVVEGLTPYEPGEQPRVSDLVKLNTNENPYPPSPRVLAAIRNELGDDGGRLRLYPDPESRALKQAIADGHEVEPTQVFVGNGSDEVLAHAFQALLRHPQPILFPDISYSFYPVYCGLYGIEFETVALDPDFKIRAADYLRPNGGIIFPNPNAPTGRLVAIEAVEEIVTGNPDSVVIVDEAYVDFGGESAIPLTRRHPNLLVVHTLSKSRSLAGMRVGFAVGDATLIAGLERVKNSFNSYPIDRLAECAAIAALADRDHHAALCSRVIASRDRLAAGLTARGFDVLPSAANFLFVRHPDRDAGTLASQLRSRRIIVRHFKRPRIEQHLRITVGTDEQCAALLHALDEIL